MRQVQWFTKIAVAKAGPVYSNHPEFLQQVFVFQVVFKCIPAARCAMHKYNGG